MAHERIESGRKYTAVITKFNGFHYCEIMRMSDRARVGSATAKESDRAYAAARKEANESGCDMTGLNTSIQYRRA